MMRKHQIIKKSKSFVNSCFFVNSPREAGFHLPSADFIHHRWIYPIEDGFNCTLGVLCFIPSKMDLTAHTVCPLSVIIFHNTLDDSVSITLCNTISFVVELLTLTKSNRHFYP